MRSRLATTVAVVVAAGLLLAACAPSPHLVPSTRHGPPDHQFLVSFPHSPTLQGGARNEVLRQYGTTVKSTTLYVSGGQAPPTVVVSLYSLTNDVPRHRATAYLRTLLPNFRGGRVITWFGHRAMIEFVRGCEEGGTCIGYIGSLVVLDGTSVYAVLTQQQSEALARSEIRTFRLAESRGTTATAPGD
jgi:hypothetical protein